MTFDDWLDEIEGFGLRRERLYADLDLADVPADARTRVLEWLRAAYEVGHDEGARGANTAWRDRTERENYWGDENQ